MASTYIYIQMFSTGLVLLKVLVSLGHSEIIAISDLPSASIPFGLLLRVIRCCNPSQQVYTIFSSSYRHPLSQGNCHLKQSLLFQSDSASPEDVFSARELLKTRLLGHKKLWIMAQIELVFKECFPFLFI